MTAKNPQKQGRILEGGGKNFSGWPEYIPLNSYEDFIPYWHVIHNALKYITLLKEILKLCEKITLIVWGGISSYKSWESTNNFSKGRSTGICDRRPWMLDMSLSNCIDSFMQIE